MDGGPIVRFSGPIPLNLSSDGGGAELLGYHDGTRPVIAYQKGSIQFVPATSNGKAHEQNRSQPPEEEKCEDRAQVVLSEAV